MLDAELVLEVELLLPVLVEELPLVLEVELVEEVLDEVVPMDVLTSARVTTFMLSSLE